MSNAEASSSKHKDRKSKKDKHSKKERHGKSSSSSSKRAAAAPAVDGPFEHRVLRMRLAVPPKFSADWMEGVRETLDGMLMRYVGQMGGVLLAHWDHAFCDDNVKLINECPYGVTEVSFRAIVWAPKLGQVLSGTHSLSSPSHLSLLFGKTFNVSIPLQHIPQDKFEFEHTGEAADSDSEDEDGLPLGAAVEEVGRWKRKATGETLGASGERVQFTVIGLQVTNSMLSLTGSLLDDPSNPPALPAASRRTPSLSPDLPEPPAKRPFKPRASLGKSTPAKAAKAQHISFNDDKEDAPADADAPEADAAEEEVDTSNMTARELKKFRKEQAKNKRDARKARKEDGPGLKRKAEDDEEEDSGERKKRKEA